MLLNRVRVLTTGVAGSPAYMNLYTAQSLVSPAGAHAAAVAFVVGYKGLQVTAASNLIEGDVAIIDTFNDSIIGVSTVPQSTQVGSGGTNQLPSANQIVVRWLTGAYAGGRQIRGRTYVPYLSTATQTANGGLSAATITTMNGAVNAYVAAMPAGSAVVYSRKNTSGYAVAAYSVWSQYGIMRSRRD